MSNSEMTPQGEQTPPIEPSADAAGSSPAAPDAVVAPAEPDAPASEPSVSEPVEQTQDVADTPHDEPEVLDEGTFTKIKEPRAEHRLALDGSWHQISPRYVVSQLLQYGVSLALVIAAVLVVALVFDQTWVWIPGAILIVMILFPMIILPRQARAIGYMLRSDDLVFRKGILWQRMVAVPYGRMQLVDITHGPLDRAFGVAQLKMVTAAASTGVQIPGLSQGAAEALRDKLIEVAETRRTGL